MLDKRKPVQKGFLTPKGKEFFKNHKVISMGFIIFIGGIIGGGIYTFILLLGILIKEGGYILAKNLGMVMASSLGGQLFVSIFITSLLFSILLIIPSNKTKSKRWFFITLWLIFIIGIFGFFAIDRIIGNPTLRLNLFDENYTKIYGTIECVGNYGLVIGEEISCDTDITNKKGLLSSEEQIYPHLFINNTELSITTLSKNNQKILFSSDKNITYISFVVYEKYSDNSTQKLGVGYPFIFLTKEQFEKNREKFIGFLIALMAAIFISIPSMMINIRKLWKNEN